MTFIRTSRELIEPSAWPRLLHSCEGLRGAGFQQNWLRVNPMLNRELFEQLQTKVSELLAQSPAQDLERNLKALLAGFFSRLELVTREEFDVQRQVLLRTREKLERLEAKVAELEQQQGRADS
jgi:hypothetical protein